MLLYKINLLRYDNLCWYNHLLKTSNSHSLINDSPGTVAFTSHIVPADRSAHCLSLAKKVNAPLKREGGGGGGGAAIDRGIKSTNFKKAGKSHFCFLLKENFFTVQK